MSFKKTLTWLVVALALFGAIVALKRASKRAPGITGTLPVIDPSKIDVVQVRPGRGLEIRVARTNGVWQLVEPLIWPAQQVSIEQFLTSLQKLSPAAYITPEEVRERPTAEQEYGFSDPKASIILLAEGRRIHMLAGSMTAPGDQFFMQVVGVEGVFVMPSDFLKVLPANANDWRDRALVNLNRLQFDRVEVTNGAKILALERQRPGPWRLAAPIKARADQVLVHDALEKIHSLRTLDFITDDPKADYEGYGLQPPQVELGFKFNSALAAHLQFGSSVSNSVYARRSEWSTVVTVPKEFVSDWQKPVNEFRDPLLLSGTDSVQSISVGPSNGFTISWQTAGSWLIAPSNWVGDADLIKEFITALNSLRVEQFVKDVVTEPDLPPYGLHEPSRVFEIQYRTPVDITNATLQVRFGAVSEGKTYARRSDEDSIYAVSTVAAQALPGEPWQLRHRQIWSFDMQSVKSVVFSIDGRTRELRRKGDSDWELAPGSQGVINDLAVEETLRGLSKAAVDKWSGFGPGAREQFGIVEASPRLTIQLADGQRLIADFGRSTASNGVFAAVAIEGQTWIGDFPWILCRDIVAHLAPPEKKSGP